jgi:putative nucleotidyltransferase with HDIG domain
MHLPWAKPAAPPPSNSRLESILRDVERVRPLPSSVARVVQALDDPKVGAEYVAHLLRLDQALAADVLRLSNSAAIGGIGRTASVQEAVVRLGFVRVKSLVLGAATATLLTRRLSGYGMTGQELWNHAVVTASLARYVAGAVCYSDYEEAYVAGLLHDIGKLVLDQYVKSGYLVLTDVMQAKRLALWQAEELIFGMDHGAVGGLLAAKWQFPLALAEAIRCHHWPSLARTRPELAAIVNIADALPPRPPSLLATATEPHPEALRLVHLDAVDLERLRAEMPWQPGT